MRTLIYITKNAVVSQRGLTHQTCMPITDAERRIKSAVELYLRRETSLLDSIIAGGSVLDYSQLSLRRTSSRYRTQRDKHHNQQNKFILQSLTTTNIHDPINVPDRVARSYCGRRPKWMQLMGPAGGAETL